MVSILFERCELVTPNLNEINTLLQSHYIGTAKEVSLMAEGLFGLGIRNVLLKGGHSIEKDAVDYLVEPSSLTCFSASRINTVHTHGTGCLLSSAIATHLAFGYSLSESVKKSKQFLSEKLEASEVLRLVYKENTHKRKESIF